MALLATRSERTDIEHIRSLTQHLSLNEDPAFVNRFVENMAFQSTA